MRIAQVAPLYESVPPRYYGGTERVVAHLTDELVRRGHDVVLFASGDSRTSAMLVACREQALRLDTTLAWDLPAHLDMLMQVRDRADEFDLLHFHVDCSHLPIFDHVRHRTVTTMHGRLDLPDLQRLYRHFPEFPLVSISDAQRRPMALQRWMGTVHHGYPQTQYRFSPEATGGYLAFLGRISPEKGADRAIAIARQAGLPLRIAAKVDNADRAYFDRQIAPLLTSSDDVQFVGEIGEVEKSRFLGGALALLVPIEWPEPFGLVMIEAMACGTPVIAFRHGSVPEIVEHGVNGFIVETVEEAAAAVPLLGSLDRRKVRASFEARFSVEAMADGYEAVYRTLLDGTRTKLQPVFFEDSRVAPLPVAALLSKIAPLPHVRIAKQQNGSGELPS